MVSWVVVLIIFMVVVVVVSFVIGQVMEVVVWDEVGVMAVSVMGVSVVDVTVVIDIMMAKVVMTSFVWDLMEMGVMVWLYMDYWNVMGWLVVNSFMVHW